MAIKIDHLQAFDSLGEFADAAAQGPQDTQAYRTGYHAQWCGSANMSEAVELAHVGWSTHRETFALAVDAFTTAHGRPTFSTTFDVTGAWVDVDRYLSGEPECMVQPVLTHDKPIVRIAVNGSVAAINDPEIIVKSGGFVTGLVDVLTAAGNAVELWWYQGIRPTSRRLKGEHRVRLLVKIKAADQPCDIDQVAFALAHPSMLRRLAFGVEDQLPEKLREQYGIGSSYGMVAREAIDHPDGSPFDLCITDASRPDWVLAECVSFLNGPSDG